MWKERKKKIEIGILSRKETRTVKNIRKTRF